MSGVTLSPDNYDSFESIGGVTEYDNRNSFREPSRGVDDATILRWTVVAAQLSHGARWVTALTSMSMHGGFMHIIGNMVFLWAFGPRSRTRWPGPIYSLLPARRPGRDD